MRTKKQRRAITFFAVILCAVLLLPGSPQSLTAFAAPEGQEEALPEDFAPESEGDVDEPTDDGQSAVSPTTSTDTVGSKYQSQIDEITEKQEELKAERAMIEQNIDAAKSAKEKEQANKNYLEEQIYITQSEIELLYERIAILEQDIADKELSILAKQGEYDKNYAQFLKRLRSLQLGGEATQLGAILGSDSFTDYMATNEMMSRLAAYDQRLMDRVKRERAALEQEKADLENTKTLVDADRVETEEKQETLAAQRQSAVMKIQDIEEMQSEFLADLEANEKMSAEMQAELDQIYKQIEWDKNPYVGGEMLWPLPGYSNITSRYGWRFGNTDLHTGMDISGSGVYGKDIVAANTGTVAFVNTKFTTGRGYGIYLIVDHGGNMSTLYGHCSNIVVSVGQKVEKGQKIAEVGSTGWSTGPHLHFEVRVNGGHTNPEPYLLG
jgi:murein DD-endopeptidase MepM/ murein hydrolase activator NlpD